MDISKMRSEAKAAARGRQAAIGAMSGMRGSKHFPDYAGSLAYSIEATKAILARHTNLMQIAYWSAQIAEYEVELAKLEGR